MSLVARVSFIAAVLSGAVLVVLPAVSFAADTYNVAVVDNAYDDGNQDGNDAPATTVITAGDTVVWEWKGENQHTVTSRADAPVQFDSDSDCGDDRNPCRSNGNIFVVRFEEAGTYNYFCKVHADELGLTGMTGTIEVQPAPEPSESDSGSSEPSSDGSSEPSSEQTSEPSEGSSSEPEPSESSTSPQEEPNPEPTAEGDGDPQDEPDGSSDDDRSAPRRAAPPGFGVQGQPADTSSPGPGPQVAPEAADGPTFSPFPSAPDLPDESETEDMAVTVPSRGGGPSRGVVVGVAIASVVGSAGVFGKVVLFGEYWG